MKVLHLRDEFQNSMKYPTILSSCDNHLICQECFDNDEFDENDIYDTLEEPYRGKYIFKFQTKTTYDRIIGTECHINVFHDDAGFEPHDDADFENASTQSLSLRSAEEDENEECIAAQKYFDKKLVRRINGFLYLGVVESYSQKSNKFTVKYVDDDIESVTMSEIEEGLSLYDKSGGDDYYSNLNPIVSWREKGRKKSHCAISTDFLNYLGTCREENFFSWELNGQSTIDLKNVIHFDKDQLGRVYFNRFIIGTTCK